MRKLRHLDQYRARRWEALLGLTGDDYAGCFFVKSEVDGGILRCMVGVGGGVGPYFGFTGRTLPRLDRDGAGQTPVLQAR